MIKKIVLNTFVTILILFLSITLVLTLFNIKISAVSSNSMDPSIKKYDLVYIKTFNNDNKPLLEEGDIALIEASNPFIHRVINIRTRNDQIEYETKGDFNNSSDGWISEDRILGKYLFKVPLVGFFIVEVEITIILVAIIVFILSLRYFIKIYKN